MPDENEQDTGMNAEALALLNIETDVTTLSVASVALLNKSEVEAQIAAAHAYPRSIQAFLREAKGLATLTREIAESCMYSVERGRNHDGSKKFITGPSVRLAEIAASSYCNLHIGARVLDAEEKEVIAQGVAWDLQKNVRITVETRRRIVNKKGERFNDDMITMTGNAAAALARRNAVFVVIPRSYIQQIYRDAQTVSIGDARTLNERRESVFARFQKMGVSADRVLAKVGKRGIDDVDLATLEILIGLGTAILHNEQSIDDVFPANTNASSTAGGVKSDLETKLDQSVAAATAAKKKAKPKVDPEPPAKSDKAPDVKPTPANDTPASADTRESCAICGKPIDGKPHPTWDKDGAEAFRHETCSPFGTAREPGDD